MTKAMEEDLRRHFTYKKLEIAYAISKPFPFVESLLDNAFITEKLYRESLEACRNLVPLAKVIYNILTKLEKSFNPSLLDTLFHPLHLYEYPNLRVPYKSFRNVVSSHGGWSRPSAILDMVDPAEGSSHQPRLLPLPAPQHPPPSPQPQLLTDPKPEGSRPRSPEILGEQPSPAGPKEATPGIVREERLTPDNLTSQVKDGDSPEKPDSPTDTVQASSDKPAPQVKDEEDTPETPRAPASPVSITREDSAEPNDSKGPQEVPPETDRKGKKRKRSTDAAKRHHKNRLPRASPRQEQQRAGDRATPRKDKSAGEPRRVTRAQKAKSQCAPKSDPEESTDDASGVNKGVRTQELPSTLPSPVYCDDEDDLTDHGTQVSLGQSPAKKKQKRRKRHSWSTPKRRQRRRLLRGAASSGHEIQEQQQAGNQATPRKDKSVGKPRQVTKAQTEEGECAPTPGPEDPEEHGSELSFAQCPAKKKRRKRHSWSTPKRRQRRRLPRGAAAPGQKVEEQQAGNQATPREDEPAGEPQRVTGPQKAESECAPTPGPEGGLGLPDLPSGHPGRLPAVTNLSRSLHRERVQRAEKSEEENEDFHSPELPVTCGDKKGILYKEKMKQGSTVKCIQNEMGVWFTPHEFEVEGKGAQSKNWKRSIRCRGRPLGQLLTQEDAPECEVCCRGGALLCCAACGRGFHGACHIPPAQATRSPWSCTFCRAEASSRSQPSYGESEVLARQMQPEEQLKCEFLLLKAYCHPQSSFFAETPHNIQDYGEPFKEAMWLDLIKERLAEKVYTAAWFVRDMRLIFHNHKTFYKASDFGQVGLDLEAEFEKDLKELLIFREVHENSFQAT